jgi:hypothetical protein
VALTDSLVASFELDEASGNAIDSVGSNDLTETSGTIGAAAGPGGVGGSRDFEAGETEYFTIDDNADLSMGDIDFTVEAWVNLETTPGTEMVILNHWGGLARGYALVVSSASLFVWRVGSGAGATRGTATATTFGSPSTGAWHQVIASHDAAANEVAITVNAGTPEAAATTGAAGESNLAFRIGATTNNQDYFDGKIAKVRLWKRVLTSGERTQLYNGGDGLAYADFGGGGEEGLSMAIVHHHRQQLRRRCG